MSAAGATGLVRRWARLYTRGLPPPVAERRRAELDADLHDQVEHERAAGASDRRIARSIASRWLRGVPADVAWRGRQEHTVESYAWPPEERTRLGRQAQRRAVVLALGGALAMVWMLGALGIVGAEGDSPDRMYLAVLAIGVVGAVVSRLRPAPMAAVLVVMAVALGVAAVVAVAGGMVPEYNSPFEVVGLNAMFAGVFLAAAWWFRRAGRHRHAARTPSPAR